MFILDTDHISLFQRHDPHVSARVLATFPQELATTVIPVEEQLRRLRAHGIRIGTQDLRIAAIVLSQNATLVTRNVRDFATIPALDLKDWS